MQAVGVLLLVIGIVVSNSAEAQELFPLDKYPGFGRSPAAVQRDDAIAAWEAFRREQVVASCMARAGFAYEPAIAFPEEPLAAVARGLGVKDAGTAIGPSPHERNAAYAATLSGDARETYAQALYGERAADLAETRHTGLLPSGRGADFATGGCVGESNRAVPSVWTLKRELDGELEAVRREIAASADMATTANGYAECAQRTGGINARGPADVERLATRDHARRSAIAVVVRQCSQIWASGYRKAEVAALRGFEQRNDAALRAAEDRFRDVMKTISSDRAFQAYLKENAVPPR